MNSRFCSIDFTFGSLILIAKENNSDFALVQDKFLNSENFINILLDFFQKNNIKIENLNLFMNEAMNSRFCSIDFTLGSLILIAKENNSDFALVKDKFSNSENFINILLDFFQQNNIKIENLNFFMINLGPGGFVGLRNILSSIKSIALVKKIKLLGFNNFQILKTTIVNQDFEKVALEVNNRFYIKDLKNCDDYYSIFTVQNALEKNSDKIVKFSKLPKYTSKNLQYILDNKLFIDSKLFPIYENM